MPKARRKVPSQDQHAAGGGEARSRTDVGLRRGRPGTPERQDGGRSSAGAILGRHRAGEAVGWERGEDSPVYRRWRAAGLEPQGSRRGVPRLCQVLETAPNRMGSGLAVGRGFRDQHQPGRSPHCRIEIRMEWALGTEAPGPVWPSIGVAVVALFSSRRGGAAARRPATRCPGIPLRDGAPASTLAVELARAPDVPSCRCLPGRGSPRAPRTPRPNV